ncbi:DUF4244 domain-containing protein [Kitasatospora sp. NPDC057015]|uniref:DUF4244 domain-containing protein n=1 Tax=Kitasatospora sp. NPDC057015 TaxID=3346001 RepID=UPI00363C437B
MSTAFLLSRRSLMAAIIVSRATVGLPHRTLLALTRRRGHWAAFRVRRMPNGRRDSGMTTAEYAVGTVAACAFAAILYKVVTSGVVSGALTDILNRALGAV